MSVDAVLSPGAEYNAGSVVRLCADVEVPVYQNLTGNQQVVSALTTFVVGYSF